VRPARLIALSILLLAAAGCGDSAVGGTGAAVRTPAATTSADMKNPGDAALQSSPAGRERIARAVARGVLAFPAR
jgi:hypothetical protein